MNTLLVSAVESNNFEAVKFLIANVPDLMVNNETFELAVINGNLEMVKFLAASPHVNFATNNYSIQMACAGGNIELVKFLLTFPVDLAANDNQAIQWARENGHFEIVKLLEEAQKRKNSQTNLSAEIIKHLLDFNKAAAISIAETHNLTEILEILKFH